MEQKKIKVTECVLCPFYKTVDSDGYCNRLSKPIFNNTIKYIRKDCPLFTNDLVVTVDLKEDTKNIEKVKNAMTERETYLHVMTRKDLSDIISLCNNAIKKIKRLNDIDGYNYSSDLVELQKTKQTIKEISTSNFTEIAMEFKYNN